MTGRTVARGERVHLRRPTAADAEEFVARVRASRRLHGPWSEPPDTPEGYAEAIVRRANRTDTARFLVCRNEDGAIAGVVTIGQIVLGHLRSAYLGYYVFAPFARQGVMTEAVDLAVRHAFEVMGLHRLEANVQPDNVASIALVERLGFRREGYSERYLMVAGRWRDHVRYAILAEDLGAPPNP